MNCEKFEILIDEQLEGNISEQEKAQLSAHLSNCSSCSNYLNETVFLLNTISELPKEIKPRKDLWENIENRINDFKKNGKAAESDILSLVKNETDLLKTGRVRFNFKYAISGLAAAVILFALIYMIGKFTTQQPTENIKVDLGVYWQINKLKGEPLVENSQIQNTDSVAVGQWISTDRNSQAMLKVADIGSVIIEPNSRVRIVNSETDNYRIMLDYGTIAADIDAKPKTFFVETKSVTAIDLGCEYTFTVDSSGDGIIYVKSGMVALQSSERESIVPAGKFCATKYGFGPGTPFRENSSSQLKKALMEFDFGKGGSASLQVILKNAGKSDAVTLLNLLPRVDKTEQVKIYKKVSYFVPPPQNNWSDTSFSIDMNKLNEWIIKIQEEVQENLQKTLENLDKHLKTELEMNLKFDFDNKKFQEELNKDIQKKIELKIRQKNTQKDSSYFDEEEFKKEMEGLQDELNKIKIEMEINEEEIKIEMERVKEELKKANEEIEKSMKENMKKEMKEKIEKEVEREDKKEENKEDKKPE